MRDDTWLLGRREDINVEQNAPRTSRAYMDAAADEPHQHPARPQNDARPTVRVPTDQHRNASRGSIPEVRAVPRAPSPAQRTPMRGSQNNWGYSGEWYAKSDDDRQKQQRSRTTAHRTATNNRVNEHSSYEQYSTGTNRSRSGSHSGTAATRTVSKSSNKRESWLARRIPSRRLRRTVMITATALLVLLACIPVGLNAYFTYTSANALALDGVRHLEAVQAKLPASGSDLTSALNQPTLDAVKPDIQAAQRDFQQLSNQLDGTPLIGLGAVAPGIGGELVAAKRLAHIGLDVSMLASVLADSGTRLVTVSHNSPLSATKSVLTQADLDAFGVTLNIAEQYINDIAVQTRGVSFSGLLDPAQSQMITSFLTSLPQIQQTFSGVRQFVQIAPMLLSIGHPAKYLVITMGPGMTGGFQGNYAVITIQDGRLISPANLTDIFLLGNTAGNCLNATSNCWGIGDANMSADFPTAAKNAMRLYTAQGGAPVDGVIALTPKITMQVLAFLGPLKLAGLNFLVDQRMLATAHNPFTLTQAGRNQPNRQSATAHLAMVGAKDNASQGVALPGMPAVPMAALFKGVIDDMHTKDVQIYSSDPQVEHYFVEQQVSAEILHGPGDGLFVVDSNLAGKQNAAVMEAISDSVQLDASGTATHTLTVTYSNTNRTAGIPYTDYVRIYAPPQSTFVASRGWTIQSSHSDEPQRAMWAGQIVVDQHSGPQTITLTYKVPHAVALGKSYSFTMQKQASNNVAFALTITHMGMSKPALTFATATKPKVQYLATDTRFTAN